MDTITITLEKDYIYALAMEAHRKDMTLNDFIIMIAIERAEGLIKKHESETE